MVFLDLIDDVLFYGDLVKWLVLAYLAYYLYNWAQEHLPFSPALALVVGVILIYYLVVEHPILGAVGIFGWILLSSGFLLLAGMFFPWVGALFYRARRH